MTSPASVFLLAVSWTALLSACGTVRLPDERPADFAVEAAWSTGSLPPQYHHRERLEITPSGAGALRSETAYGDGPSGTWSFQLNAADLDTLYDDLREAGLVRSWLRDSDPPVGGSSWWADVTAAGQTIEIPAFVRRGQASKERVGDALRAAVPGDVWAAHREWLAEAQAEGTGGG